MSKQRESPWMYLWAMNEGHSQYTEQECNADHEHPKESLFAVHHALYFESSRTILPTPRQVRKVSLRATWVKPYQCRLLYFGEPRVNCGRTGGPNEFFPLHFAGLCDARGRDWLPSRAYAQRMAQSLGSSPT